MTLPDHCAADLSQRPDLARKGLLAAGGTFRQAAKTAPRRGARIAELSQKKISTGMGARFVRVDDDRELLLPPDMRQSVPQDPLVDFIMDGVEELDVRAARVNQRGTGDEQYPPAMTLGVAGLVLCARNVFELGDRGDSSVANRHAVPDGGSTAALLGFALVGVVGLHRKFRIITA
jgi:VPDSG-CTERM motif